MGRIEVMEVPPRQVIGIRRTGSYADITRMIHVLFAHARERGLSINGAPFFICHEMTLQDATRADSLGEADLEVVLPVSGAVEPSGTVQVYSLPGGTMARALHQGPHEQVVPAYRELFAWLAENGKRLTGPTREVYVNAVDEVPPGDLRTEIYAPFT